MFSKRSNFIPRLNCAKRNALLARLIYIAESWGGKEHGYGLAECCHRSMKITDSFPKCYYEYYDSNGKLKSIEQDEFGDFIGITNLSEIAYLMCCRIPISLDDDQKMLIFTRVRLSLAFHDYETQLQFVLARLQALSVLVYSNSLQDNINTLDPGFLEELVELLEMRQTNLAALRSLTSIIHLP
ncbi:E3 ubiquitin-protein ligase HUWE1-like [Contarinia nasturtii]|uniref:E3 ubiquitin-protein ligase HUWE1-like n=1 Tax=Contarinia nasturtii TaxID=265458 RepID=UPI0012D42B9B|nr:E3 ubiquitin-protein ligase HUWE1-like [Contarinia nasturtii]XP_031641170.1 E3 ubiquitin-protein ligase HUWE1-like [Contarinia nasturtii]